MSWTDTRRQRLTWIGVLTAVPLALAVLVPPADYLPEGRQNWIQGFMVAPPGLGIETGEREIMDVIDARLVPHLTGEKTPVMESYYLGSSPGFGMK